MAVFCGISADSSRWDGCPEDELYALGQAFLRKPENLPLDNQLGIGYNIS